MGNVFFGLGLHTYSLITYFTKARNPSRAIRIIVGAVVLSLVFDGLGYFLALYFRSSTISNNIYAVLAFVILSWFYAEILFKKRYKAVMIAGTLVFIVSFVVISVFFFKIFSTNDSFSSR